MKPLSENDVDSILDVLEEHRELLQEHGQLLGEILSLLDDIRNAKEQSSVRMPITEAVAPPDADYVDSTMLSKAIGDAKNTEISIFWPKAKAPKGWARVSVQHTDLLSLNKRISKGCLCGKAIVTRKFNDDEFLSCEGVVQKGGCDYRPAVYFDKLTFLTNLPPKK